MAARDLLEEVAATSGCGWNLDSMLAIACDFIDQGESFQEYVARRAREENAEEEPEDPARDIVDREDGTTPRERAAAAARQAFIGAAIALLDCWDPSLDKGYPARLPDFGEFVNELLAWRDKER